MKTQVTIRRLTPEDSEECVALRQAMLAAAPHAFLASPEQDIGCDLAKVRERLTQGPQNATFGAFTERLVGSVGMFRERHAKAAHKVNVWGMYVSSEARRQGIGRRLLDALVAHARTLDGVTQVNLSVSEAAPEAQELYESAGFRIWGEEPRAMSHEGRLLSEKHMVLFLT